MSDIPVARAGRPPPLHLDSPDHEPLPWDGEVPGSAAPPAPRRRLTSVSSLAGLAATLVVMISLAAAVLSMVATRYELGEGRSVRTEQMRR